MKMRKKLQKSVKKPKPARSAKATAAADELITQPDFLTLLTICKNRQHDIDRAKGAMGGAVKLAIDKKHLDRPAFAMFQKLDRLPSGRLRTTLRHLHHYIEIGGLNDRAQEQLDALESEEVVPPLDKSRSRKKVAKANGNGAASEAKPKRVRKAKAEDPAPVPTEPSQIDLSERDDLVVH